MKILFDHQIFSVQNYGGISRYFIQIISNLPSDVKTEIGVKYSDNEYLLKAGFDNNIKNLFEPLDLFLPCIKFHGKGFLFEFIKKHKTDFYPNAYELNKKLSIELLKKQEFDVFHPTYYDDYFLEYLGNKPFVLTIHDMIDEIYPELTEESENFRKKAILARKANHIIAVSEKTKDDIIKIYNLPESKVSVIYHGNSFDKFKSSSEINLPEEYLLFVGKRDKYKNFLFLLLAIQPILKENKELKFVCVGMKLTEIEREYITNLDLESQIIVLSVSDNDLYKLYSKAKAFIFPSYYEGFGIPIIEAFQAGCPVLLSNSSCFPEIAKDAALYFDSKNPNHIRTTINEVLNNEKTRNELIKKGYERSNIFSWKISSEKTYEIYKYISRK